MARRDEKVASGGEEDRCVQVTSWPHTRRDSRINMTGRNTLLMTVGLIVWSSTRDQVAVIGWQPRGSGSAARYAPSIQKLNALNASRTGRYRRGRRLQKICVHVVAIIPKVRRIWRLEDRGCGKEHASLRHDGATAKNISVGEYLRASGSGLRDLGTCSMNL